MIQKMTKTILVATIISSLATTNMAFAGELENPNEVGTSNNINIARDVERKEDKPLIKNKIEFNKGELSLEEANEQFQRELKEFSDLYNSNDYLKNNSESIVNRMIVDKLIVSNLSYSENWYKLREANFIEGILNVDEGLTNTEIARLISYSSQAKTISTNRYPNNANYQDSLRHFAWNFLGTSSMNVYKVRTAANNHEWGLALRDVVSNKFTESFNKYRSQGYSENQASNMAFGESVAFIPTAKDTAVRMCKASYSFYKSFFDKETIMDFHNNVYGRSYAGKYSSLSVLNAFDRALSNWDLIVDPNGVTDTHYRNVWENDWYTY